MFKIIINALKSLKEEPDKTNWDKLSNDIKIAMTYYWGE